MNHRERSLNAESKVDARQEKTVLLSNDFLVKGRHLTPQRIREHEIGSTIGFLFLGGGIDGARIQ